MTAPVDPSGSGMTAAQLAALLALVQAQAATRERFSQAAAAAAVAAFRGISWWSGGDVSKAVARAVKGVQPLQRAAARATDAFLARAISQMKGKVQRPVGVVDVGKLRRDIPEPVRRRLERGELDTPLLVLGDLTDGPGRDIDAELPAVIPDPLHPDRARRRDAQVLEPGAQYGRVAEHFRFQVVAEGTSEEAAEAKALLRVAAVAETDVTLAVREQFRAGLVQDHEIRGWRRILHPELSKSGPCGLCVVAADRVYHVKELEAIHLRCRCEVLPIVGDMDPGISLNADDLKAIYDAAGGTGGEKVIIVGGVRKHVSPALKNLRVAMAEHGEIGPVLVDADQHWRGPAQVAKSQSRDPKVAARAELAALTERLAQLEARHAAGDRKAAAPIAWQRNRIAELRRILGTAAAAA